jgi:ACDE family multidrug resistance protein
MQDNQPGARLLPKGIGFLRRQPRDWKVTVVRSSLARFVYQMIFPYQSVYTVALGATATQLGVVNSVGMGVAGVLSPLVGWLIDRIGIKKIYLLGIGFLFISYLIYGVALSWTIILVAMAAFWLGETISGHSCATVCGNSLKSEDRATAMTLCETLAAGLLGIVGPLLGALLVAAFGGANVGGIRPLFFMALGGTLITFVLVYFQLSARRWNDQGAPRLGFFGDMAQVLRQGRHLKRWLVIVSVGSLPLGMVFPFSQVFAHQVKGADSYVLGFMVTGCALTSLLLGIPMGRLADRIGRKKVLYLTLPLFWASNLVLIWAPRPGFLIAAGVLQGFYYICATVAGAMSFELVPSEHMGRWIGLMRFCRFLLGSVTALIAGIIWDTLGPQYVFLTVTGLDVVIRLPLLIGMPETLGFRKETAPL